MKCCKGAGENCGAMTHKRKIVKRLVMLLLKTFRFSLFRVKNPVFSRQWKNCQDLVWIHIYFHLKCRTQISFLATLACWREVYWRGYLAKWTFPRAVKHWLRIERETGEDNSGQCFTKIRRKLQFLPCWSLRLLILLKFWIF